MDERTLHTGRDGRPVSRSDVIRPAAVPCVISSAAAAGQLTDLPMR